VGPLAVDDHEHLLLTAHLLFADALRHGAAHLGPGQQLVALAQEFVGTLAVAGHVMLITGEFTLHGDRRGRRAMLGPSGADAFFDCFQVVRDGGRHDQSEQGARQARHSHAIDHAIAPLIRDFALRTLSVRPAGHLPAR
jgi:hypothetical protein